MILINFVKGCDSDHTVQVYHPSRRAYGPKIKRFEYILICKKKTLQLPYCRHERVERRRKIVKA